MRWRRRLVCGDAWTTHTAQHKNLLEFPSTLLCDAHTHVMKGRAESLELVFIVCGRFLFRQKINKIINDIKCFSSNVRLRSALLILHAAISYDVCCNSNRSVHYYYWCTHITQRASEWMLSLFLFFILFDDNSCERVCVCAWMHYALRFCVPFVLYMCFGNTSPSLDRRK